MSGQGSERSLVHIEDDGFMNDDIQVNIEDIIADEDNDDIGKLYILSLTEFHKALGDMWDKREAKIFLLTEAVLRDHVGLGNRWEQRSKEVYVMLFPTLSQMEAEARTFDIAEQLGLKIIGERFDGARRPHIRFAGVDPKDAVNDDGTLNIDALEQAGRTGKSAGSETKGTSSGENYKIHARGETDEKQAQPNDEPSPDWRKKNHESIERPDKWKNNPHAKQDDQGNWHENEHAAQEANLNWEKRHHQTAAPTDPNWKKGTTETSKKADDDIQWISIDKKKTASNVPSATSKEKQKPSYSLRFAPCWDRKAQSLSFYKSILRYENSEGVLLEGLKAYAGHKTDAQRLKIDLWVLQTSARSLNAMVSKKITTPVFIPFHSSSLRMQPTDNLFKTLSKFSENLRKNYLILEIMDDGRWTTETMQALLALVKPLGFHIALSPNPKNNFTAPLCSGINWVGLDLSNLNPENAISPEGLNSLYEETKEIDARSFIFGISKRVQLSEMLDLGADLLSGPALVRSTEKIRPPFALPIERLQKQ